MEIGNIIKKYRTLRNITQEAMAEALSITPQAVSRWETGLSYPDIAIIPEISRYLKVSADELLGLGQTDTPLPQTDVPSENLLNQTQLDCLFDYAPVLNEIPKTVLIVDDSDFMRMMLSDILKHDNHMVVQAESGEKCLEILDAQKNGNGATKAHIDTVILDIMMPGMNGFEALEKIKKIFPELKIIILSAQCTETNAKKALKLGAASFIAKPFSAGIVSERV